MSETLHRASVLPLERYVQVKREIVPPPAAQTLFTMQRSGLELGVFAYHPDTHHQPIETSIFVADQSGRTAAHIDGLYHGEDNTLELRSVMNWTRPAYTATDSTLSADRKLPRMHGIVRETYTRLLTELYADKIRTSAFNIESGQAMIERIDAEDNGLEVKRFENGIYEIYPNTIDA